MHQQALHVDEDVPSLVLDLTSIIARQVDTRTFFRALDALAVDDRSRRASLLSGCLATGDIQSAVQALEPPVIVPQVEVTVNRAARRQVLGYRATVSPCPARTIAHSPLQAGWCRACSLRPWRASSTGPQAPIPRQSGRSG